MISYKLVNGKFEKQADIIHAQFSFDQQINTSSEGNSARGGVDSLRDISPLRDGLAVITTKQGLSVIRAKDAKLTANTLTLKELQDQIRNDNSQPERYNTYEVSGTSQFDKLGDIFSSQILQKGIMIYNRPEDNIIMLSSVETGMKLLEAVNYTPSPA